MAAGLPPTLAEIPVPDRPQDLGISQNSVDPEVDVTGR
jgi:hypothetical protein